MGNGFQGKIKSSQFANYSYIFIIYMHVHLIKEKTIADFINKHSIAKSSFKQWLNVIKYPDWVNPANIIEAFGSADLLGNGCERVVFNIGSNKYRLVTKYNFVKTQVHLTICWIWVNAEYIKLCKANKQYDVRMY